MSSDSSHRQLGGLPGGWILQALPFAILAVTALRIRLLWSQIPSRFPIHWSIHGQPDHWATKSFLGVYGVLLLGAAVCAILFITGLAMAYGLRKLHAAGANVSAAGLRQGTMMGTFISVEFFLALMLSWTAMLPLRAHPERPPSLHLVVLVTLIFAVMVLMQSVRAQRRSRARVSAPSPQVLKEATASSVPQIIRQNPQNWKAGMFYVNRNDPAIFVPKLSGGGYTLNFGHPAAWLLFAVLLFLPLAMALFLSHS
jgi:uncharacterized membrane protein